MSDIIDLGNGYTAQWLRWSPDRSIPGNFERYKDIPDIEKSLLSITCPHGVAGGIHPDTPEVKQVFPEGPHWTINSWDPLTITPSILCHVCGCHGYIREGKWVPA